MRRIACRYPLEISYYESSGLILDILVLLEPLNVVVLLLNSISANLGRRTLGQVTPVIYEGLSVW